MILDKKNRTVKYSSATFLANGGIRTLIDDKHKIAHNKVMVIDGQTVITGSFNFTRAAEENNAENLLVIRDKALAEKYAANWQAHAQHSEPYKAPEKGYSETDRAAAEPPKANAPAPTAGGFVASSRSQVFHRPDCKSAAKICPANLVHYATREEAIRAGKKPCAECRP